MFEKVLNMSQKLNKDLMISESKYEKSKSPAMSKTSRRVCLFVFFFFFQNLGILERSFKNVKKGKSLNLK